MKSTSMIGVSLRHENDAYGVIIVESDSQDDDVAERLDVLVGHEIVGQIARIVYGTRGMLRELRDSREYNLQAPRP